MSTVGYIEELVKVKKGAPILLHFSESLRLNRYFLDAFFGLYDNGQFV